MATVLWYTWIFSVIALSKAQSNSNNKLWILLDDTSVFQCRGINNKFQISEKDVVIRNAQGTQVHYLEAPGTYVLNFHKIQVDQPLPNLSGQLSGLIQIPVVEVGRVLNWDVPYNIIPERQMLGGYKCDKSSGAVQDGGKLFCRYCDVCTSSQQVDQLLQTKGHKYLPKEGSPEEEPFDKICTQIDAKSYSLQRTISVPDRQELEREANNQFKGVGSELKKKVSSSGRGKLQMELQLISSDQHSADKQTVYSQSSTCRCCLPGVNDLSCKVAFLGGACNQQKCMDEYAGKCIRGNAQKVGCFTVQFNYQVTDKPSDVQAFLKKHNYQDEYNDFGGGNPNSGGRGGQQQGANGNSRQSNGNSNSQHSNNQQQSNNGNSGGGSDKKSQCVSKIKEDRFKRLCDVRWQPNFCCGFCAGSC